MASVQIFLAHDFQAELHEMGPRLALSSAGGTTELVEKPLSDCGCLPLSCFGQQKTRRVTRYVQKRLADWQAGPTASQAFRLAEQCAHFEHFLDAKGLLRFGDFRNPYKVGVEVDLEIEGTASLWWPSQRAVARFEVDALLTRSKLLAGIQSILMEALDLKLKLRRSDCHKAYAERFHIVISEVFRRLEYSYFVCTVPEQGPPPDERIFANIHCLHPIQVIVRAGEPRMDRLLHYVLREAWQQGYRS
jgi:hypothetical protein